MNYQLRSVVDGRASDYAVVKTADDMMVLVDAFGALVEAFVPLGATAALEITKAPA